MLRQRLPQLGTSVEAILRTGQDLIAAKGSCTHGEFGQLFDRESAHYVGMGIRSAQKLIAIAGHPAVANAKHVSLLPPSWGTLYELSRAEVADVECRCESLKEGFTVRPCTGVSRNRQCCQSASDGALTDPESGFGDRIGSPSPGPLTPPPC